MPVYEYRCIECREWLDEIRSIANRDAVQECPQQRCSGTMERQLGAPRFRFAGVPTKGGGPDKFTADMLRIPLKDLPEGLKADFKAPK